MLRSHRAAGTKEEARQAPLENNREALRGTPNGGIGGSIGGWCSSSAAPLAAPSAAVPSGERFAALSVDDLVEEELPAATERALQEALEMPVFE